jgi:hypothetical protein
MQGNMTNKDIVRLRLANQQIAGEVFTQPDELVSWMGCIQAQDYAGAKWAIGSRIKKMTDAAIEKHFNEGSILRTHVLRPTWHFIAPKDIHWMLHLTASKIRSFSKGYNKQLGIDTGILKRSKNIITRALEKNTKMTREALGLLLNKEKINTGNGRIGAILMDAELDALICNAGREGKQFTYILLDEPLKKEKSFTREEAIATLASRYFRSRGPATMQDFAWWSGLSITESRRGIEMNKKQLDHTNINGNTYWFSVEQPASMLKNNAVFLLPAFDEYAVAYKDRSGTLDPKFFTATGSGLKPVIIRNGRISGTWSRTEKKDTIQIEAELFEHSDKSTFKKIAAALKKYGEFREKKIVFLQ